jgi:signal peptidase I
VRVEGRHLVKEARRILKKRGDTIQGSVAAEVKAAADEVDAAVAAEDFERSRAALTALDELLDEKLAFARKSTLREYAESIGVAVAIALLLRAFVVEAFQIPSASMVPTLEVGDHIFVAKYSYGIGIPFTNIKLLKVRQPERGEVIVFKFPINPSDDYIKRVVGLPGDRVELRHNELFINGRPVPHHRVSGYVSAEESSPCELWAETLGAREHKKLHCPGKSMYSVPSPHLPAVVPSGMVFVMGDNRDNSSDSRAWGYVPQEFIKGKALIVWWSRANTPDVPWYTWPAAWAKSIRWSRFFTVVR